MVVVKRKVWFNSRLLGAGVEVTLFWDINKPTCSIQYLDYEKNAVYTPDNLGFIRHDVKAIPLQQKVEKSEVEGYCAKVAPVWLRVWEVFSFSFGFIEALEMTSKIYDDEIDYAVYCKCDKMEELGLMSQTDIEKTESLIAKNYPEKISVESNEHVLTDFAIKTPKMFANPMTNPMFNPFMFFSNMFKPKKE